MIRSRILVAVTTLVALALIASPAFAQKAFLDTFKQVYPGLDNKFANCSICHNVEGKKEKPGKKNLNSYGKDLQNSTEAKPAMGKETKGKYTADELKAVAAGIKAIGSKDSNGNGKSNDDDIKAGVKPGN